MTNGAIAVIYGGVRHGVSAAAASARQIIRGHL